MKYLLFIFLLSTALFAGSRHQSPVRFQWETEGSLHGISVHGTANVYEDGTWDIVFTNKDEVYTKNLRLEINGTYENINGHRMRFKSDYAKADVILKVKSKGKFQLVSSNIDLTFDDISFTPGFIEWHKQERLTNPFYTRRQDKQSDEVFDDASK